tara:strand:- start:50 stop:457 length:408 start_codon:yes stop_codon:yes gene_type:complete
MKYVIIFSISFILCSCLPVDSVLLPNPKRSFITGEQASSVLEIKTHLYKGALTYYTKTTFVNSGNQNIMLIMVCAYYDKKGLVSGKRTKILILPPKSKARMYKRLFYIEQRYDWKCSYHDSDGVVQKKTSVRVEY